LLGRLEEIWIDKDLNSALGNLRSDSDWVRFKTDLISEYESSLSSLRSQNKKRVIDFLLNEKESLRTKQFLKVCPEARQLLQIGDRQPKPVDTDKVFEQV
jgi:hypothetical protein